MFASTHAFCAFPEPPAAVFTAVPVVRVIAPPAPGLFEVAWTPAVPTPAEVIVTVQVADAPPLVQLQEGALFPYTTLFRSDAVAVCGPASIVPLSALTVIVNTWLVPTGFVAV